VSINQLFAGDQLVIVPPNQYLNTDGPAGIYEVVTPPANWNSGTTMVLQRIADSNLPFGSPLWSSGSRGTGAKITQRFVTVDATNNTGSINSTYYYNGDVAGRPSFIKGDANNGQIPVAGTLVQFSAPNNRWEIVTDSTTVRYFNNSTASTPPASGWSDGSSGTASVGYSVGQPSTAYLHKHARETRFVITGCTFDGPLNGITRLDGSLNFNISPSILAKCPTVINGCSFAGHNYALSCGPQFQPAKCGPFVITNNYFYGKRPEAGTAQNNSPNVGYLLGDHSIFANNILFQNDTTDYYSGIVVGGDRTQIVNNTFIVGNPIAGSVASPNLPSAIGTYNARNNQPWNMVIDGNVIDGWNYGISTGGGTAIVGRMYGNATGAMINPFHPIQPCLEVLSPNGTPWRLSVTNDGEVQLQTP
jgi:hypothetical protein